jgi:hypothetical protein
MIEFLSWEMGLDENERNTAAYAHTNGAKRNLTAVG